MECMNYILFCTDTCLNFVLALVLIFLLYISKHNFIIFLAREINKLNWIYGNSDLRNIFDLFKVPRNTTHTLKTCSGCIMKLHLPKHHTQLNWYQWMQQWHEQQTKAEFDVCWTVHHCDNWRTKNQLDATYYFIVLLIGSTCFRHYYAHHQELAIIMLNTTLVVSFLVCCRLEVRCG